jgi:anti-sigma regulatory factor (Ser/Thr protein kinase)
MDALLRVETVALVLCALICGAALTYGYMRRAPARADDASAPLPLQSLRTSGMTVPLAALLPAELPVVDGLRLSASYVPGAANAGGGDFYDAFFLEDDRIAVAIGDAAGHGAGAIATMNVARQAIRSAFFDGARPADVLRRANRAILRSDSPAIVTTVVGVIDPATLQLRYACAGHPPPIVATADGTFASLPAPPTTIPLGAMPHHATSEQSVTLPVDALVALYTDGCVDLDRDADAGTRAFGEALAEARKLKPNKPAATIDRAIFGTRERADDAAILTIAPEPTLAHLDVKLPADPPSAPLARNALRRFFAATPLDERRTYDALVAVGEAVSNAIEHAYGGRAHQVFEIHARSEGDACTVFVEDAGSWRDDGAEPAGRGVLMMRRLSDDCRIERGTRGSRVILRFAFAPSIADVALRAPLN